MGCRLFSIRACLSNAELQLGWFSRLCIRRNQRHKQISLDWSHRRTHSDGAHGTALQAYFSTTLWDMTSSTHSHTHSPHHQKTTHLPFPPYPQNYVLFMTDNKALVSTVAVTWLISGVYLSPPNLLLATRNVFAWSFDRLVPTAFSTVSKRLHRLRTR